MRPGSESRIFVTALTGANNNNVIALTGANKKTERVAMAMLGPFLWDESGTSIAEYGLVAALISLLVLAALSQIGMATVDIFAMLDGEREGVAATLAEGME